MYHMQVAESGMQRSFADMQLMLAVPPESAQLVDIPIVSEDLRTVVAVAVAAVEVVEHRHSIAVPLSERQVQLYADLRQAPQLWIVHTFYILALLMITTLFL